MATFSYVAFDRGGKRIEGSVEAADRRAALLAVEKMGQVPVNVTEQSPAKAVRATAPSASIFCWICWQTMPRCARRSAIVFTIGWPMCMYTPRW